MPEFPESNADWPELFFRFLTDEKDASVYTQRNYRQAIDGFGKWYRETNGQAPPWADLKRDSFRLFLRQLGRKNLSQAAIRLRFSALNSFYKFLMRRGLVEASPVKGVTLPKPAKRLPQFLTIDQMIALLNAPEAEYNAERLAKEGTSKKVRKALYLRDRAILETIYSCGLRIGEMCRMTVDEIDFEESVVNVQGKGKKERQVPIGRAALDAIQGYWQHLTKPPAIDEPVFFASETKRTPIYPRLVQMRLKKYLNACKLDATLTPHMCGVSVASSLQALRYFFRRI